MKTVRLKLVLLFISIMIISSMLSFLVFVILVNDTFKEDIVISQYSVAASMVKMNEKSILTVDEIIDTVPAIMYKVNKIANINSLKISDEELKNIQNGQIVHIKNSLLGSTVFKLDDSLINVTINSNHDIFRNVRLRVGLTLLLCITIGAILIIFVGKRAITPIVSLTYATKEVAKGNFNVHIDNKSKDEIGELTRNFNKMTEQLKGIEYLRKDFISNVSHEFKTPIASIQGFAKLLQDKSITDIDRHEYLEIIVEETSRLSKLTSNILRLSKLENQEMVINKTTFSLDEQIRKVIVLLEHEWSKKNIDFNLNLESVFFNSDEELLQQVWINLINNAIKFSSINSIISIKLIKLKSCIQITISDNGIGMDENTIERIFEKFYQGDKAHASEGNGLGLSLVKRIVDLCHGKICVSSNYGQGTTFIVELPN